MPDLLDVNVWLALSAPRHVHHPRARRYWDTEAADELAFCRVTALGLVRLLSSDRVLRDSALDGAAAWRAIRTWLATPSITYLEESPGLDDLLGSWGSALDIRGRHWTDAYLAAFATSSGSRLVSFDSDFRRFPGLAWQHLETPPSA